VFTAAGRAHQQTRRLDADSVDDRACRLVLERCESAEVDVAIWETTTDIELPSFLATLVDRNPSEARAMPPMSGSGCHPRRNIALLRALTEAAQGRLTIIAGSREGLSKTVFDRQAAMASADRARRDLFAMPPTRRLVDAPDVDHVTFEEDVAYEIAALQRAGLDEIAVVNLTHPRYGIAVVRVVIPGLEAMSEVRGYVPGERAQRAMASHSA
jgi:ribosomal protein S12 methylthiotransferase accessory factor